MIIRYPLPLIIWLALSAVHLGVKRLNMKKCVGFRGDHAQLIY